MHSTHLRNLVLLSLLVAVALIGLSIFVPSRPAPNGPHAVGRIELTITGSNGRRIPITAWYPTIGAQGGKAVPNAPLIASAHALILYSSGWTGTRTVSSIQTENLASHGFVVVACDDYASDISADPDDGLIADLSSNQSTAATIARASRHVDIQATILLDILHALGGAEAGPLAGRLNLSRVGVLGYSIGGAAGAEAAARDERIVAVFNLDGWLAGPSVDAPRRESYFLLSSNAVIPLAPSLASADPVRRNEAILGLQDYQRNTRRMSLTGSFWIRLDNADHEDLSDRLFALRRSKILRSNAERLAINDAIGAYEVAFFRSALLGEINPLLTERRPFNQHVRWISSTAEGAPGTASAPE